MCGIAGIILKKGADTAFLWQKLQQMSAILAHRGPDDEGYWIGNKEEQESVAGKDTPFEVIQSLSLKHSPSIEANFGFLHRRLAIQDLSPTGHQPIIGKGLQVALTYNGEIYNFRDLPVSDNASFPNKKEWRSDTQALLSSWESFGPDFLNEISGMFAFAVLEREAQKLTLARDRTGVKPLYYINSSDFFAFASEQKALLPLLPKKTINPNAIADYLINNITEGEGGSFWNEIHEVPPGALVRYDLKTSKIDKSFWFKPVQSKAINDGSIEEFEDIIRQSVRERLLSAVPVGTCLSGGIDSSLLTALVNKERKITGGELTHCFTAQFPGFEMDEGRYAALVSEALGLVQHTISPDVEYFLSNYEKVVIAQDIPFFGASTIGQYGVFSLPGPNGIKVTLDGQGADELFTGYPHHLGFWLRDEIRKGRWDAWYKVNIPPKRKLRMVLDHPIKRTDSTLQSISRDTITKVAKEIRQDLPEDLESSLFQEFYGPALKVLLRTGDRNSMAHSIESRVPFADSPLLAEKALQVGAEYKLQNGITKIMLRKMGAGLIPETVLSRKDKIGFAAPEKLWLNALLPMVKGKLELSPMNEFLSVKDWNGLLNQWLWQNKSPQVWKIINLWAWFNLVNK